MQKKELILYTKYSNDRADCFNIRTDIRKTESGERKVVKLPWRETANDHIRRIAKAHDVLKAQFRNTEISVNECTAEEGQLSFAFLEGETLESRLDALLADNRPEELVQTIETYFEEIRKTAVVPFDQTEAFQKVFGEVSLPDGLLCGEAGDIDMVFANIMIQDGRWHVIDYEWTFFFPVPVNFIIFRALHYYLYLNEKRAALRDYDLYARYGISQTEQEQYERMERKFQEYVVSGHTTLHELYKTMTSSYPCEAEWMKKQFQESQKYQVQVYYDVGNGLNESDSYLLNLKYSDEMRLAFEIEVSPEMKLLRIDPSAHPLFLQMLSLKGVKDGVEYPLRARTNGIRLENKDGYLFESNDPQILIPRLKKGTKTIRISWRVRFLESD